MKKLNLVGQRFGKLYVVSDDPRDNTRVICKCDCGNVKSIRRWSLTMKRRPSGSCGCNRSKTCIVNAEHHNQINRAYNTNFGVIESDKPYSNNHSGYKGVCWDKARHKWSASITCQGKRIRLGRFDNIEDAVKARQEAVERIHNPIIEQKESDNFE